MSNYKIVKSGLLSRPGWMIYNGQGHAVKDTRCEAQYQNEQYTALVFHTKKEATAYVEKLRYPNGRGIPTADNRERVAAIVLEKK